MLRLLPTLLVLPLLFFKRLFLYLCLSPATATATATATTAAAAATATATAAYSAAAIAATTTAYDFFFVLPALVSLLRWHHHESLSTVKRPTSNCSSLRTVHSQLGSIPNPESTQRPFQILCSRASGAKVGIRFWVAATANMPSMACAGSSGDGLQVNMYVE